MLTKTVDLTRLCAVKEIQHIIEGCDYASDSFILLDPFYKQRLTEYVLSNLSHRYLEIKNLTEIPKKAADILPQCPLDEKIVIRQLLHLGMTEIFRELTNQIEVKSA